MGLCTSRLRDRCRVLLPVQYKDPLRGLCKVRRQVLCMRLHLDQCNAHHRGQYICLRPVPCIDLVAT
jgi:hypothetical protein